MKILFITFYDPDHIGTKLLAGYMHSLNHTVTYLQFKTFPVFDKKYNLPENQVGQQKGKIIIKNVYEKGWEPISKKEITLFELFVKDFSPDIFCFSYRNITAEVVKEIFPFARKNAPSAVFIAGGFGPTFEPEYALTSIGFDVVVRGEGEEPLRDIVEAIEAKKPYTSIKNCCYLDDGKVICNPLRPLLRNLDKYPFGISSKFISHIEHDTLAKGDYRTPAEWPLRGRGYPLMATRGCPLHCSYCSSVSGFRNLYASSNIVAVPYRRRKLTHVLNEIRQAKDNGEKSITFVDEFVIYPYEELAEFLRVYKRDIKLFFFAYFNTEQFLRHSELIDLAVDAGLVAGFLGVQHGSEQFCRKYYNRINCNENFLTLARKFFNKGIMCEWSYIIGNLLETESDFEETLEFSKQMPFDPGLAISTEVSMSKLRIFKNTSLEKIYPKEEYSPLKMYYNAQLVRLRPLMDDDEFSQYRTKKYKDNPFVLSDIINDRKQSIHKQYIIRESARLTGKDVLFFGFGKSYKKNKSYFHNSHPICILHDLDNSDVNQIDGIPVCHIANFLKDNKWILNNNVPIIIFSYGAYIIHRKLMRDYPNLTDHVFVQLQ